MRIYQNSIATPYLQQAYNLHKLLFNSIYPFALEFRIQNGKLSFASDKIFRLKYIPFLIATVFVSATFGLGSCAFLLVKEIFRPNENFNIVAKIFCIFLGRCLTFECGIYHTYCKSKEVVLVLNELFEIERYCKFLLNIF